MEKHGNDNFRSEDSEIIDEDEDLLLDNHLNLDEDTILH